MTRFIHLTDLHVSAPQTEDPGRQTDTAATLARVIDTANGLSPRPDFAIVSGDMTNIGDQPSYELVAQLLDRLEMPVLMTLGNHDRRAPFHAAFAGQAGAPDGPVDHDAVIAGLHVILLDSSVPGRVAGALDAGQFDFLAQALARHPEVPKLLVLHHPPRVDPDDNAAWASLNTEDTARLGAALAGHDIRGILSGHVHFNRVTMWNGIPSIVTTGLQSTVDLTRRDALAVVEGTGFALCRMIGGGLSTTFVPTEPPRVIKEIPAERLRAFA
ncbi:metallophosphoesterase [Pseudooceanicola aestuarii]|uniref:metallophosphoesterase n=1 Tax=Pseudooceanicola aestuarii TaxID=2697319 RepID=UPI0013CFBEE8|nr:metallophosphoesterase [Pseudooceanicola aestuarii]